MGGYNLLPVRFFLSPNLYSAVLRIFFAPRFHINYFLLFSVMGVSPENFGFPPCEKDFFLHRNLLPIPSLWRATVSGPGNRPGRAGVIVTKIPVRALWAAASN